MRLRCGDVATQNAVEMQKERSLTMPVPTHGSGHQHVCCDGSESTRVASTPLYSSTTPGSARWTVLSCAGWVLAQPHRRIVLTTSWWHSPASFPLCKRWHRVDTAAVSQACWLGCAVLCCALSRLIGRLFLRLHCVFVRSCACLMFVPRLCVRPTNWLRLPAALDSRRVR